MNKSMLVALALMGCGDATNAPEGFVPHSSQIAWSQTYERGYVTDADNGSLTMVDPATAEAVEILVGTEPAAVTRYEDLVAVTLRVDGVVHIYRETPSGLELVLVVTVGAEPEGIVFSPDGQFLYVAVAQEGKVVKIDVATGEIVATFQVGGEPRWVAIHPDGGMLYVGSVVGDEIVTIDLLNGEVLTPTPLPPATHTPPQRFDTATFEPTGGEPVPLEPRVTGSPTFDPDGHFVAIPALYIDKTTPAGGAEPEPRSNGYAMSGGDSELGRFNPVVIVAPVRTDGQPDFSRAERMLVDGAVAAEQGVSTLGVDHGNPAMMQPEGDIFVDTGDGGRFADVPLFEGRGYVNAVVFEPEGRFVFASMEGVGAVSAVPVRAIRDFAFEDQEEGSILTTIQAVVNTGLGSRSLALDGQGNLLTWAWLDRAVTRASVADFEQAVDERVSEQHMVDPTFYAAERFELPQSELPSQVLEGRRLFFSANDATMSSVGSGVSCATCHVDGRTDGSTFTFDHGVRQVPSLAGPVDQTAPITWSNDVDSVATEVHLTSQNRMGGDGITAVQAAQVAAFINSTRDVILPIQPTDAVERGREVFFRDDVGCGSCHFGDRYTDNGFHAMVGEASVNTPGLVGVAATAPYLHDGSAADLAELIDIAENVGMGKTNHLSAQEKSDLEAFLRSL